MPLQRNADSETPVAGNGMLEQIAATSIVMLQKRPSAPEKFRPRRKLVLLPKGNSWGATGPR